MHFEIKSTFKTLNITAAWFTITLVSAISLYILYSEMSGHALDVILYPISRITAIVLHAEFNITSNGFYFPASGLLIDKHYTGFNFLLVVFCLLSWSTPYHLFSGKKSILFFIHALVLAYVLTIVAVPARIAAEAWLSGAWLPIAISPTGVSKLIVYLPALVLSAIMIKQVMMKMKYLTLVASAKH